MVAACHSAPIGHPPSDTHALGLVNRFVAAETLGTWRSADSLVRWTDCEGDPAEDQIPITKSVRVGKVESRGDTAFVPVQYDVVGAAWSDDARRAGVKHWHFKVGSSSETVTYGVFADSSGHLWIACGEFHEDHTGAGQFRSEVSHFDDHSLAAWRAASLPSPQ